MSEEPSQSETQPVPVSALEAMTRAEYDVAVNTARKFPRKPKEIRDEIRELATLDEETAAACFYSLPRGGKNITGPSIRLAEIVFSAYGNITIMSRVVGMETEGPHKFVTVQAICRDLQKNSTVGLEKPRRIVGKLKNKGKLDEDDIQLATNAALAIVRRDAIFQTVPGIYIKPALDAARKVAIGDATTLRDRRAKAIDAFAKLGVSLAKVLAFCEKGDHEDIGLEDMEKLIGAFNAIKDGTAQTDELFPDHRAPSDNRPSFGKGDEEGDASSSGEEAI